MIAFLLMVILAGEVPAPLSPHDTLEECKAAIAAVEQEKPEAVKQLKAAGGSLVCYEAKK